MRRDIALTQPTLRSLAMTRMAECGFANLRLWRSPDRREVTPLLFLTSSLDSRGNSRGREKLNDQGVAGVSYHATGCVSARRVGDGHWHIRGRSKDWSNKCTDMVLQGVECCRMGGGNRYRRRHRVRSVLVVADYEPPTETDNGGAGSDAGSSSRAGVGNPARPAMGGLGSH